MRKMLMRGSWAVKRPWTLLDTRRYPRRKNEAQREKLMLSIMKDVSRIAGIEEDSIWVYLCNLEPTDMVEYGHVLPKPGGEKAWFEGLPDSLKTYLARLGTDDENFTL